MNIHVRCHKCGKVTWLTVNPEGYVHWQDGGLIQMCLPELNEDTREMLMTGLCSEHVDELYKEITG